MFRNSSLPHPQFQKRRVIESMFFYYPEFTTFQFELIASLNANTPENPWPNGNGTLPLAPTKHKRFYRFSNFAYHAHRTSLIPSGTGSNGNTPHVFFGERVRRPCGKPSSAPASRTRRPLRRTGTRAGGHSVAPYANPQYTGTQMHITHTHENTHRRSHTRTHARAHCTPGINF